MSDPMLINATTALTLTVPQITTGTTYVTLVGAADQMLGPINTLVVSTTGMGATDPITYANTIVADVSVLWSYLNYGSNLAPGLVSFGLLISAYLLVMLIKVILVVVMYVKQLVANWL
jgi:hypothetical protein